MNPVPSQPEGSSAEWLVFADETGLRTEALRRISQIAHQAQQQRGVFRIALSGGNTPRQLYEAWRHLIDFDWQRTELYWGDERAVPPTDRHSNYHMVRTALLDHVAIPQQQVHRMPADLADLDAAAQRYEATLRRQLGAAGALDLVLLGLGTDAHTASLFPGEAAVQEAERWVQSTPAPIIAPRITGTPILFNAARHVIFLVAGDNKQDAIALVRQANGDVSTAPARAIHPDHGTLTWLLDQAAAEHL
jgi:6-phosphogluconolactonase